VKKSSKFSSDELLGMLKALSEAPEKADNVKKLYDEIVGGSSSDEMSKKEKSAGAREPDASSSEDTTITINQWERGGYFTINHFKDTTVKKADINKVKRDREYKPK
jgi:hypothetical protein